MTFSAPHLICIIHQPKHGHKHMNKHTHTHTKTGVCVCKGLNIGKVANHLNSFSFDFLTQLKRARYKNIFHILPENLLCVFGYHPLSFVIGTLLCLYVLPIGNMLGYGEVSLFATLKCRFSHLSRVRLSVYISIKVT